jgi:multicomponent Na+:H+ antiporter subunit F
VAVAVAGIRVLIGPSAADRVLAVQLIGTGATAVLLLVAVATGTAAAVDVALVLALVAAFATAAFCRGAASEEDT